jgi:hypothetical protein
MENFVKGCEGIFEWVKAHEQVKVPVGFSLPDKPEPSVLLEENVSTIFQILI